MFQNLMSIVQNLTLLEANLHVNVVKLKLPKASIQYDIYSEVVYVLCLCKVKSTMFLKISLISNKLQVVIHSATFENSGQF